MNKYKLGDIIVINSTEYTVLYQLKDLVFCIKSCTLPVKCTYEDVDDMLTVYQSKLQEHFRKYIPNTYELPEMWSVNGTTFSNYLDVINNLDITEDYWLLDALYPTLMEHPEERIYVKHDATDKQNCKNLRMTNKNSTKSILPFVQFSSNTLDYYFKVIELVEDELQ